MSLSFLPGRVSCVSAAFALIFCFWAGAQNQESEDIQLEDAGIPLVTAGRARSPVVIDGNISDAEWEGAGAVKGFSVNSRRLPSLFPSEIRVLYDDSAFYTGLLFGGGVPSAPTVSSDGSAFNDDGCYGAVFLDPGDTNLDAFHFFLDSGGTVLGRGPLFQRLRDAVCLAKTALPPEGGWRAELKWPLPFEGVPAKAGDVWGLNVVRRESPDGGRTGETSGFPIMSEKPVSAYATVIFGPESPLKFGVKKVSLSKKGREDFILTACLSPLKNDSRGLRKVSFEARITPPLGRAKTVIKKDIETETGDLMLEETFKWDADSDGGSLLTLIVRDEGGLVSALDERKFQLTRPRKAAPEASAPFWPAPKKWTAEKGFFQLPEPPLICAGTEDAAAAEELGSGLARLFGASTRTAPLSRGGEKGAVSLLRAAPGDGLREDGMLLEISPERVTVTAAGESGVLRGVRAFLDSLMWSALTGGPAGAPCGKALDFPSMPQRVFIWRADAPRRGSPSADLVKNYTDRVLARGGFNLVVVMTGAADSAGIGGLSEDAVRDIIGDALKNGIGPVPGIMAGDEIRMSAAKREETAALFSRAPFAVFGACGGGSDPEPLSGAGKITMSDTLVRLGGGLALWRVASSFGEAEARAFSKDINFVRAAAFAPPVSAPWVSSYDGSAPVPASVRLFAGRVWSGETRDGGAAASVTEKTPLWLACGMGNPGWGLPRSAHKPLVLDSACNGSVKDEVAGDGFGWVDLGPERDFRSFPAGRFELAGIHFERPMGELNCVKVSGAEKSKPVTAGLRCAGLAFAVTAAAGSDKAMDAIAAARRTSGGPLGLPAAGIRVKRGDRTESVIPLILGWNLQLWDCPAEAAVLEGAAGCHAGFSPAGLRRDPNSPDARAWLVLWRNPAPENPVREFAIEGAGLDMSVFMLGACAVTDGKD